MKRLTMRAATILALAAVGSYAEDTPTKSVLQCRELAEAHYWFAVATNLGPRPVWPSILRTGPPTMEHAAVDGSPAKAYFSFAAPLHPQIQPLNNLISSAGLMGSSPIGGNAVKGSF